MLSFMPPSSPLPADPHQTSAAQQTSTMSLAILPSAPIAYHETSPAIIPSNTSRAKRPKLSLNTSGPAPTPVLLGGKGSTSLRLETLSATSPTSRNTFKNGYNPEQVLRTPGGKPQRPSLTPIATNVSPTAPRLHTPIHTELASSSDSPELTSSSAASSTSVSTLGSLSGEVPYKLAYNVNSILKYGPIPRTRSKMTSFAQSRPMFPPAKKVVFRAPLTEEIKNVKYTMAHSDIESSSTISTLDLPPQEYPKGEMKNDEVDEAGVQQVATTSPQRGEKRESDEEDSDTCPATPVAGRRKRHRQWRWTLGPIDSDSEERREQDGDDDVEQTEGT